MPFEENEERQRVTVLLAMIAGEHVDPAVAIGIPRGLAGRDPASALRDLTVAEEGTTPRVSPRT